MINDLSPEPSLPPTTRLRWCLLLLLLAAPAVYAALSNDIASTAYDAATVHVYQGRVFSQAISDGVLYPRWVQFLHWGLGSPLFTFRAPLPYYTMDLLFRLGLPHAIGWRVLMASGLLAACAGTYLLVFSLTRQRWPSLAAGIVFLYAPYVLRNTFERGSPEVISLFLAPWVLWSLVRLAEHPSVARVLLASLLWGLCIASHVLGPLMLAPIAVVMALAVGWRYRTFAPAVALVAGGLLTAFIWAPIIPEQGHVHLERDFSASYANPTHNPIALDRLLALPTPYDTERDNNSDDERIGLLHAILLLSGIPAAYLAWRRQRRHLAVWLACCLGIGLALFWMLTSASDPLWRLFDSVLERLQYRSRLDGLLALAVALVAGLGLTLLPRRLQSGLAGAMVALVVLFALPSLFVGLRHHYADLGDSLSMAQVREAEIKSGGSAFTYFGEFTPRWRQAAFDRTLLDELGPMFDASVTPLARPVTGVTVQGAHVVSSAWDLTLTAAQPATLVLHLLYYPRWQATIDGQPIALTPEAETGYVRVEVPAGEHRLALRYGTTLAERAGLMVSAATLLALLALLIWERLRRRVGRTAAAPAGSATPALAPSWWSLGTLSVLLALKIGFVDGSTTWLRCVSTADWTCGAQASTDVNFGEAPRLRGYKVLTPSVAPGETFILDLFWLAEPKMQPGLNSFVHIRNSQAGWPVNPQTGSEIWAQSEHVAPGDLLLSDWVPGKLYRDSFRIALPAGMPRGTYYLEVGWFDMASGEQLDPQASTVVPPLKVLWRSILLPAVEVR